MTMKRRKSWPKRVGCRWMSLSKCTTKPSLAAPLRLGLKSSVSTTAISGHLKTDLSVTTRLAELIPDDRIVISESGIRSRADIERLSTKVDAFLVGSSLMASPDILQAARALVFGPVKICGLTCRDDLVTAAEAGATYAGFIFAEESPRQVDGSAAELASEAHRRGLVSVGVFGRESEAEILRLADEWELRAVQLHGDQDARALRSKLRRHCEVWSVTGVGEAVETSSRDGDRTVFDRRLGGRTGGTGKAFGWSVLAGHPDLAKAFIAGGIGPANARAAQRVGAYGLDVGSALEMSPRKERRGETEGPVRCASPAQSKVFAMLMDGRFGRFGGCYVPEILVPALEQLEAAFIEAEADRAFCWSWKTCWPIMRADPRR